jgi:DNA-binding MarR family transcriptional regulator
VTIASSPRLLALHGVRLRGRAEAEDVAEYMGADPRAIRDELEALEAQGHVEHRPGRFAGFSLTPAGRAEGERLLAAEIDEHGLRPHFEATYGEFLAYNRQLLTVCSMWQLREVAGTTMPNDHSDRDHDQAVLDALDSLDHHVRPVLAALCDGLARFAGHETRLRYALDRVLAGEHDWLTKPMFPSYHSCWFELHEDLLATLGRERTTEGSP